jgi:hypothetical protein
MKHEIQVYGRWMFYVSSASRPGLRHLVDLEPDLLNDGQPDPQGRLFRCDCEADAFAVERPCRHVRAVIRFLKPVFAYFAALETPKKEGNRIIRTTPGRKYKLNKDKVLQKPTS